MPVWKAKGDGKNMYVLLYLLWILLNGRVTAEILAVGVPVAGLVYGFGYQIGRASCRERVSSPV